MDKKQILIILPVVIVFLAIAGFFYDREFGKKSQTTIRLSEEVPVDGINDANKNQEASLAPADPALPVSVPSEDKPANSPPQSSVPEREKVKEDGNKTGTGIKITSRLVSWGFEKSSGRKIDTIVVHSSYNALSGDEYDTEKIIDIYESYGVAAHYIIDRKGTIFQLVSDQNIAYHAGQSRMPDGRTGANDFSIGIEIVNNKNDKMTDGQYLALNSLIGQLKKKYAIKHILGHSDIAQGRKDDPWGLEWSKVNK